MKMLIMGITLVGSWLQFTSAFFSVFAGDTTDAEDNIAFIEQENPKMTSFQAVSGSRVVVLSEKQNIVDVIGAYVSSVVLREIELYPEYTELPPQTEIHFVSDDNNAIQQIYVVPTGYQRMRIELGEFPSVIVDYLPLEDKSSVFTFTRAELFRPNQDMLDLLEIEPNLLAVIDNQSDVVKKLTAEDTIEVLVVGKYREDTLEKVEKVLAIRLTQKKGTTLLFTYMHGEQEYWFGEDLQAKTYPFLQTPTNYIIMSSGYGVERATHNHHGIDFAADIGTPIYAAASGVVSKAGWGTGYGLMAKISHEDIGDYQTVYAHMSRSFVREGQHVLQGQKIGLVGSTGRSTGPHLHYELHKSDQHINPYGSTLKKNFKPTNVDKVLLADYRDSIDRIFVEATNTVVDMSDILAYQQNNL